MSFYFARFLPTDFVKVGSQQQSNIIAPYKPDMCIAVL